MRLTILGCAGSVPGPNTNASGYLLEADGYVLGLELGNGTLSQLQSYRSPFDLDALIFSHLHPDHCADFGALTVIRRYYPHRPEGRPVQLPVYGPADTEQRLVNLYAPNEPERAVTDLRDVYEFHPLPTTAPFAIGPFEVIAYEVLHPTPAYGLRVSHAGATFAFTGDTGVCPVLDELAKDADVLLSEASWTDADDRPLGVHLSGVEAGQLAQRTRARRLLLTHVAPWTDRAKIYAEARTTFDGPLELVEQGATYDI